MVDVYSINIVWILQALLATVDTIDAFILLQNMAPLSYDSSRLVDVACIAYADVNHEHMQQLRSSYEESVNARIQVENTLHLFLFQYLDGCTFSACMPSLDSTLGRNTRLGLVQSCA